MLELAVLSLCRIAEICWNEVAINPILNPGFSETTEKKREGGGGGGGTHKRIFSKIFCNGVGRGR